MAIRLSTLISRLKELEQNGHSRDGVCVDVESLFTGNGTFQIADINDLERMDVRQVDGDGFGIINKDGFERTKSQIVLKG